MDAAALRDEVLLSPYFLPVPVGLMTADHVANYLVVHDEGEVRQAFETLVDDGMVEPVERSHDGVVHWRSTELGWHAREALLRARRRRHPALMNQRAHQLQDLIVAIAMSNWIAHSSDGGGGFLGPDDITSVAELRVYLPDFPVAEIGAACTALVEQGLATGGMLERRENRYSGIALTQRGERAYKAGIRANLGISEDGWILQETKRDRIVVFFAWQSDYSPSRNHLTDALRALERASAEWGLATPLEVGVAVEPEDGALRIDAALQQKIKTCDVFVGDLTPVYRFGGRLNPNPNILIEAGFALAALPPTCVVLAEHRRILEDIPGSGDGDLPFDIRQVYRIQYAEPKDLRAKLIAHVRARLVALGLAKPA